jgi:hypothetical protein
MPEYDTKSFDGLRLDDYALYIGAQAMASREVAEGCATLVNGSPARLLFGGSFSSPPPAALNAESRRATPCPTFSSNFEVDPSNGLQAPAPPSLNPSSTLFPGAPTTTFGSHSFNAAAPSGCAFGASDGGVFGEPYVPSAFGSSLNGPCSAFFRITPHDAAAPSGFTFNASSDLLGGQGAMQASSSPPAFESNLNGSSSPLFPSPPTNTLGSHSFNAPVPFGFKFNVHNGELGRQRVKQASAPPAFESNLNGSSSPLFLSLPTNTSESHAFNAVATCKMTTEATTLDNLAFSDASLPKLPQFVLLEIMSFLNDDRASLQALLVSCKALNLDRDSVKIYLRKTILDSENGDIHCCMCAVPVAYPYKLVDCQHVACGRCVWTANHKCGLCKTKIRSRPLRLGPEASKVADTNAFWILPPKANAARIAKNEARIHMVTANPFDGKGLHADFDDVPALHVSDLENIPRDRELWIICPATCNYGGFPETFGRATNVMRYLERTSFLQRLDEDDIVLIEEEMTEEEIYIKPRPDRYEVRLVGWEQRK